MARIFRSIRSVKLPQRGREAQHDQYWREQKGATKCPACGNIHFKKRWYASEEDLMKSIKIAPLPITDKKLCQACTMVKDRTFEGELFIQEVPSRHREDVLKLVNNFGERATQMDPQHRIITIEDLENGYRITTTENQLATRLAKKIEDVFNTVSVRISHSAEPAEVGRVHATFHGT